MCSPASNWELSFASVWKNTDSRWMHENNCDTNLAINQPASGKQTLIALVAHVPPGNFDERCT